VGFDVTPATVIGFLTILGYSLYDTVVVFDKVRENTRAITTTAKQTYSQAANLAVNQTLVRSFNTSLIALLPVASILFVGAGLLGAGTLKDLSLALFIGLATGTYSSIFVATPILATLREREPAMIALRKRVAVRNGASPEKVSAEVIPGVVTSTHSKEDRERGPRNQPKRKSAKKR
jgi:preprotein translocase subunit SecF